MGGILFRFGGMALAAALGVVAGTAMAGSRGLSDPGYRYYEIGDPDAPRPGQTRAAMMLMGGGDWVPEAFHWWVERAGHGRVVILRASGDDDLQRGLYRDIGGVTSVQTLVFDDRKAAENPAVLRVVRAADAIFIAGGDQSRYVRFWKGTRLNQALNEHVAAGKPIGGTSAGLAILGGYSYGALDGGSIDSPTALEDPMGTGVTLVHDFLSMPWLSNVVTDTHFAQRERLGRLIVFVARAAQEKGEGIVGIGVDEDTVLCVEGDGSGRVHSLRNGHVWLVAPQGGASRLSNGEALDFGAISVTGVGVGSRLQLDGFRVDDAAFTTMASVVGGELELHP